MSLTAWFVVFLIGVGLFVGSIVVDKPAAAGAAAQSPLVEPLRMGGVLLATLGLCAMAILSAVSGGLFATPPA